MHIVTRRTLLEFGEVHADAGAPLDDWYRVAKAADWKSIIDVRATFPHADFVDPYTVFNIKGNEYRLIVKIEYLLHLVFIKSVHTHADYDKGTWK
jgi:mRNA interferase HigB